MHDDPAAIAAREHLRANREAVLIADGLAERVRFIIDGATGRIVFPSSPATTEALELVLFIPEEDPADVPELQLLLSPLQLDPDRDFACDRWRAYHGDPQFTRWLSCAIESARFAGEVVEVDAMNHPNQLAGAESALCRLLNADRARLASLCQACAGLTPREPLAVGVDDSGIDIRARFGIIRIAFPHPANTREEAEKRLSTLLEPRTS